MPLRGDSTYIRLKLPDLMDSPNVLCGLHLSVSRLLPLTVPSNLEELFILKKTIHDIIHKHDPFRAEVET
jgi:hypothetical protein